jgi:predicted permease
MQWNWLFRRKRAEADLDDELRDHLQQEIQRGIEAGLSPEEAHFAAQRLFGPVSVCKEECRDARGTLWLDDFLRDCGYGLRVLKRSPVFTTVAILSLALGIGAGTAIFSLVDRVMFRMLPVREPRRLVQITRFHPPYGPSHVSYPLFLELAKDLKSFDGLLAYHDLGERDITISGSPESAHFDLVSNSYYRVLGVNPAAGRLLQDEKAAVAVISYRYWRQRFASDPALVGKTFRRLDTLFTIVGVTAREFSGPVVGQEPDITVPLSLDAQVRGGKSWLHEPDYNWLSLLGRLKSGWTLRQAQVETSTVFARIAADDAAQADVRDRKAKLSEYVELQAGGNGFDDLRRRFGQPLLVLMGAVFLVLLLACANLANLLLARAASRQREMSVRLAMGAGRGRVVRQLFTEGLLIALGGGALGVLLAYWFDELLLSMFSNGGARMPLDISPDGRVLLFALAVSIGSCILFSLAPAVQATRPSRAGRRRLGNGLVVAQMAISVLLLITAGLFGRTLLNIYSLDPGFDRHGVILFSTNAAGMGYTRERIQRIQTRVPADLEASNGIQSASVSLFPPLSGGGWDGRFLVEGHSEGAAHINSVGADFFKTFRTAVVLGREFNRRDTAESPRVVIVNEAFARAHFPEQSPIGKWVAFSGPEKDAHYEIVGVVKDMKYESLRHEFPPTVYMMSEQVPLDPNSYTFALRTNADMATAVAGIERTLARIDTTLRPVNMITLQDHVAQSLLRERMLATLAGFFGLQALVLSAIGIYGVIVFQVARCRREIGIRIALGANSGSIIGMVLGQTARLTLAGAVIGALSGLVLTRGTEEMLYGIRHNDPATILSSIAALLLIALAAAYLPGLRAARTNPSETLRTE